MAKAKMRSNEFPSNSLVKPPEERAKTEKVTKGVVTTRQKPLLMRIFTDAMPSFWTYILWDILVPAGKELLDDLISNGKDILLYGAPEKSKHIRRDRGRSYVSYNSMYDHKRKTRNYVSKPRSRHSFDDIVLETRMDAEEVLSSLIEIIDQYEVATVADFYSAVGLDGEWNDHKFGWDNLSTAEVRRIREGYILRLPAPEGLD